MNFVNRVIDGGGKFKRIQPQDIELKKTGIFNPSIMVDDGKIYVSFRNSTYTLYYSENLRYTIGDHYLDYIKEDSEDFIRTSNYICELTDELNVKSCLKVQTKDFDREPQWRYAGLEDPRLVKWDNKLFLVGVRRDDNVDGRGRIELSEIKLDGQSAIEVGREKLPTPFDDDSYCEKNWMPILDEPYRFVKWTNPTEVVVWNPETKKTYQELHNNQNESIPQLFRGGSQVVKIGEKFLTIIHEVTHDQVDGKFTMSYMQRFIEWDRDWNISRVSHPFRMLGGGIEFVSGMAIYGDDILISFGFQDSLAFLLKVPFNIVEEFLNEEVSYAV
jgi:predicted GH43/DUF377 family glycosyl hydrolase